VTVPQWIVAGLFLVVMMSLMLYGVFTEHKR
jgi:hypothetical protein